MRGNEGNETAASTLQDEILTSMEALHEVLVSWPFPWTPEQRERLQKLGFALVGSAEIVNRDPADRFGLGRNQATPGTQEL